MSTRPGKDPRRRSRSISNSPPRNPPIIDSGSSATQSGSRKNRLTPSASLTEWELVTQEESSSASLFSEPRISKDYSVLSSNPRSFPYSVKQQCWEKAEKVRGRDPDRWRRDALGNIVFRKLVGCPGCLCHDYDHIVPFSKVLLLSYWCLQLVFMWVFGCWCFLVFGAGVEFVRWNSKLYWI